MEKNKLIFIDFQWKLFLVIVFSISIDFATKIFRKDFFIEKTFVRKINANRKCFFEKYFCSENQWFQNPNFLQKHAGVWVLPGRFTRSDFNAPTQCHDAVLIGYTTVLPDMDLVGYTRPNMYLTRIS